MVKNIMQTRFFWFLSWNLNDIENLILSFKLSTNKWFIWTQYHSWESNIVSMIICQHYFTSWYVSFILFTLTVETQSISSCWSCFTCSLNNFIPHKASFNYFTGVSKVYKRKLVQVLVSLPSWYLTRHTWAIFQRGIIATVILSVPYSYHNINNLLNYQQYYIMSPQQILKILIHSKVNVVCNMFRFLQNKMYCCCMIIKLN